MLKDRGRRLEWQMSLLIPLAYFRVNVFNLKMDRIVQSLELRFVQHKQLYKDLSCLDPAKFKTTVEKGLEDEALEGIMKSFLQISKDQVTLELFSFASNFDVLKLLLNDGENYMGSSCNNCKTLSTCPSCVLKCWHPTDFMTKHDNIYELYKVVCTLSVTQVQCERTFSKLKVLKTRLRNSLSEENLKSYMLLSIEKE